MKDYGGFEHNLQSLRVVDELEAKYANFPGLNLTFETREGILKHCSKKNARELGSIGQRFLERRQAGLEAQLVDISDAIAYNNHDVDDGFRAGLLSLDQLCEEELFSEQYQAVHAEHPKLEDRRLIYEIIRRMINYVVTDLIEQTSMRLDELKPLSIEGVRSEKSAIVGLGDQALNKHLSLKRFLNKNLYQHEKVLGTTGDAKTKLKQIFSRYMSEPSQMPEEFSQRAETEDKARVVADYIAGMTDRFAISEHERLN